MGAAIKPTFLIAAFFMLSAVAIPAAEASPPLGKDTFTDWPEGWVSGYRRFEEFLTNKKQVWPAAGLQLVGEGEFIHSIPDGSDDKRDVDLDVYEAGAMTLSTATRAEKGTDLTSYGPGVFCVCAKSRGMLGYQYHFPIVWWESVEKKRIGQGPPPAPFDHLLHVVPAPGEGMAVWPNEWLLGYLDFNAFTGRLSLNNIYQKNEAVSPNVHLGCDEHGVIERDLFPDAKAEALLSWRIYHEEKLVEKGKASGITRLEMTHGFGTYLVILGVEGPAGFLPISNFSHFPLFPDGDGPPVVVPRDSDSDGTPDFVGTMLESGVAEELDVAADQDTDGDGLTDIEEAGPQVIAPASPAATESRQLLRLWGQWQYELKNHRPVRRGAVPNNRH